jgi:hypothetical protein
MKCIIAKFVIASSPKVGTNGFLTGALLIDRLFYLALEIVSRSTNPIVIAMLIGMHLFRRDQGDGHLIFCPHFD